MERGTVSGLARSPPSSDVSFPLSISYHPINLQFESTDSLLLKEK